MSSDDNYIRLHDYSYVSDSAAESLKDVTKGSNESSSSPVELLHTLLKTGTLEELAQTILETTSSIWNTVNTVIRSYQKNCEYCYTMQTQHPKEIAKNIFNRDK